MKHKSRVLTICSLQRSDGAASKSEVFELAYWANPDLDNCFACLLCSVGAFLLSLLCYCFVLFKQTLCFMSEIVILLFTVFFF